MSLLRLDYTHTLAHAIGATHGLTDSEIDTLVAKFPKHHENIELMRRDAESLFFDAPYLDSKPVKDLVKKHRGNWEDLVVLGLGGAAITPQMLIHALVGPGWNLLPSKARKGGPRISFMDNLDPWTNENLLAALDLAKTQFLIVTKTGQTPETNALILWLLEHLKKKGGKSVGKQIMIATENKPGPIMELAAAEKCETIAIPLNLGDRYALLGNHNLYIAGMLGLDIQGLLDGAAEMDKRCRHDKAKDNPAYMHSLIHYLLTRKRRKTVHAMMGFSERLKGMVQWYDQQLAVSLGKMNNRKGKAVHVGPDPTSCVGPSGNYGQMQLYQEGPYDKCITFITVDDHQIHASVPKSVPRGDAWNSLAGAPFSRLIECSYHTAAQIISQAGRPNMTVHLENVSERTISGLCYMLELSLAMSAELYGIDPFSQPGVEANKQGVYALMGRSGFEDRASVLNAFKAIPRQIC